MDRIVDEEQLHSDDMRVLSYLLQSIRGLSPVSTGEVDGTDSDEVTFS